MAFFFNKTMVKRFSFDYELDNFLPLILKTFINENNSFDAYKQICSKN